MKKKIVILTDGILSQHKFTLYLYTENIQNDFH